MNISKIKKGLGTDFRMKDSGEAIFCWELQFVDKRVVMHFLFRSAMHAMFLAGSV